MAAKAAQFLWFWAIWTIYATKITIFQLAAPIASSVWSKPFRTWKSRFFGKYLVQIDFSWHFCDFCRVPIEDFPKNHDSEHDFDDQHEVNGRKSCSVLMILSDLNDLRDKNHDFSARGTNCLKRVIEAVQNVKITFFRQIPRANRFFVTFLWFL